MSFFFSFHCSHKKTSNGDRYVINVMSTAIEVSCQLKGDVHSEGIKVFDKIIRHSPLGFSSNFCYGGRILY